MTASEIRLRLLTSEDADWMIAVDAASSGRTARGFEWHPDKLRAALDEGIWATDERMAWAITADSEPVGFALVTDLETATGTIELRILPDARGQGIGRRVLRLIADHHFAHDTRLLRLTGKTHEANVPMQRAFVASGFRMEARFRDSFEQADGTRASEWGYALTRNDWEAGRVEPVTAFDLHGRQFVVDPDGEGNGHAPSPERVTIKVLQEGRRVLARYEGGTVHDGECAGLLVEDVLTLRFIHEIEIPGRDLTAVHGMIRGRIQRLGDGRIEVLANLVTDNGEDLELHLVEPAG